MYQDLGDTYSEQRDECNDEGCAVAMDFSLLLPIILLHLVMTLVKNSYIFLIKKQN